jgi:hypothetical protein
MLRVLLSDGARLEIPAVALRYRFEKAGDMLESAAIVDDEVECIYQSGDKTSHSIDSLLHLDSEKNTPRTIVCIVNEN